MKNSTADCVKFFYLCQFLENISLTDDKRAKEKLFQNFLKWWFEQKHEICTIYPALRLISQPNDINDCLNFEYSHIENIINNDLEIKVPECEKVTNLPILMKIVLLGKKYPEKSESSELSITCINDYLDQILQEKDVQKIITFLLKNMNNLERKWFILILLSEVENITNLHHKLLLNLINPSLEQFLTEGYNLYDLLFEYHPETFTKEKLRNNLKSIKIGKPLFPMKLNDFGPTKSHYSRIEKFCKGKLQAEIFYQGEHIIMHRYRNGECYKFFSDTMDDYTKFYQSSHYNFPQEIEPLFKKNVEDVILEGQMLILCRNSKKIMEKFDFFPDGTSYDTRFISSNNPQVKICFYIMDILYLNGKSLFDYPFEKRSDILNENIFDKIDRESIMISTQTEVKNYEDFFECLYNANIRMQEGFILRDSSSIYISGEVPIYHCYFKIKPDYNKFITLTMAVVGCEYYGAKASPVKYFLLAARGLNDKLTICLKVPATSKSALYRSLVYSLYINKSYYVELPNWLENKILSFPFNRYILQNHITIVEVKWTKINQGSNELIYISNIKTDKKISDLNSTTDVEYFNKRLNEGLYNIEIVPNIVDNLYQNGPNCKRVCYEAELLDNWKCFEELIICVLNCQQDFDIKKIQQFIYFLGASVVAHPTKETNVIIATDSLNIKTAAALEAGFAPILDASWAIGCISEKRLKKIDLQNEIILENGKNGFSLQNINLLIEEKEIPENIFNSIFV